MEKDWNFNEMFQRKKLSIHFDMIFSLKNESFYVLRKL